MKSESELTDIMYLILDELRAAPPKTVPGLQDKIEHFAHNFRLSQGETQYVEARIIRDYVKIIIK